MDLPILEISQYVVKHPILIEKTEYKKKYVTTLKYFVDKYCSAEEEANAILDLYKMYLLPEDSDLKLLSDNLKKTAKGVVSTKMRKFKLYSYRYTLLVDVLFICTFFDSEKGKNILEEIKRIYRKRYWKKLDVIFEEMYKDSEKLYMSDQLSYIGKCINSNRKFIEKEGKCVLVTANMSAGKSTLLNALIGKKVNKTKNDVCTSKIHYLVNKSFEDTLTCKYDAGLNMSVSTQNILEDDADNIETKIYIGTKFRSLTEIDSRICFVDTPGVNSSQNERHKSLSEKAVKSGKYDILLFVLNAENIGTNDDKIHMEFVANTFKGKVIFLINKLDAFRSEDSIPETIEKVRNEIRELGFTDASVYPISAYAAFLAKRHYFKEKMDKFEVMKLNLLYQYMNQPDYHLEKYYPVDLNITYDEENKMDIELLVHSGILSLEKILK